MFKKFIELTKKNLIVSIGGALLGYFVYTTIQSIVNPPDLQQFKGGIQNHWVWTNKGECYFVRPHTSVTTYLIRVEDCDKGNK